MLTCTIVAETKTAWSLSDAALCVECEGENGGVDRRVQEDLDLRPGSSC